jgi:hypothetical protein
MPKKSVEEMSQSDLMQELGKKIFAGFTKREKEKFAKKARKFKIAIATTMVALLDEVADKLKAGLDIDKLKAKSVDDGGDTEYTIVGTCHSCGGNIVRKKNEVLEPSGTVNSHCDKCGLVYEIVPKIVNPNQPAKKSTDKK